jgi:MFS family permease
LGTATDHPETKSAWPLSLAAMEFPQFRWLITGNIVFFLAVQGQVLTRTFLAWELTHREMALATINVAFALPMLVASFFGGAVSDRVERRRLVIIGQSIIVVIEAAILVLLLLDSLQFWHMVASSVVAGLVVPFIMPARTAIVFNVVGARRMGNAMALNGAVMNMSRVLGPAMMGLVIEFFTVKGAFVVSTALYTLGVLCMFGVAPSRAAGTQKKPLFEDIAYGFRYAAGHQQVLVCLLFGLVPMFLAMPVQNLLVVFSEEVWQVGEWGFGVLLGTAGLGGVIGSFWVARRGENPRRLRPMILSAIAFGAFLLLFSLSPWFYLALVPLLLANVYASACQTFNNTAVQLLVDDAVRGRMSALMMMSFALTPLGVLPLAFTAEHIGAPEAVAWASLLLIVVVILFYLFSPVLRQMDDSVKQAMVRGEAAEQR